MKAHHVMIWKNALPVPFFNGLVAIFTPQMIVFSAYPAWMVRSSRASFGGIPNTHSSTAAFPLVPIPIRFRTSLEGFAGHLITSFGIGCFAFQIHTHGT